MKRANLFINGYGRIGRILHRILLDDPELDLVAINSRSSAENLAYLLKYDSTYGKLPRDISFGEDYLKVDTKKIKVFVNKNPGEINFKELGVDIVAECTGKFRDRAACEKQLGSGARKVVISAPGKGEDACIVMGINHDKYAGDKQHIISNASCTTNCLAVVVKVLHEKFGIKCAHMTTIHAVTRSQNVVDGSSDKDLRKGRSLLDSFIPTSTGSDKAIGLIFPDLQGKISATAIRVPFSTVSMIDLVAQLKEKVTPELVNQAFEKASQDELKGILGISFEPLVSIDYKGETRSAVVDSLSTNVLDDNLVKVFAWYDNEWGYTTRFYDLIRLVARAL
ncbi:MAG: Glyceraldehyde-3-phosphate dehydrogenase, type I [Candidatus Amesbacteria bacterium GW2011_GWA2_47_11b]|uniref:Glyceraldehyde-3-phosphate dehydrogenase n=3 Tax=Candidatus Amesiibacteriota TaxID=1752730 RepID=A0A0G1SKP0_9BACT|nr:MAG: Glyceraldehyde-3-phosphate dehydrogenase, type I [Microgenomates group bacterium GW2011_GWC1_46_20]KKU57897.1 MAG: Glyceraldehyde-3-phosphate dehydrogenase, type I [Candidatus Amesbacteria bacterium GW2011_GWA2_47_11b]KKU70064.1 MAG: Glyceraldehyde-3-phosphate dehydrogenase, type I [Candidatus Amesbacteria bacterium GW2011_GWA1_47_20]KKU83924.1 MAG: Glyceraldehyde-3-phosphate dehydrogenase, type I [Candidatus Amesbacteria bacterium GW2011_GWC2_47_8]